MLLRKMLKNLKRLLQRFMIWELQKMKLPKGYKVNELYMDSPSDESDFTVKWDGEWQITLEVFRDLGAAFLVAFLGAAFFVAFFVAFAMNDPPSWLVFVSVFVS